MIITVRIVMLLFDIVILIMILIHAKKFPLPSLVMDSGDHNCTVEATRRCILAVEGSTNLKTLPLFHKNIVSDPDLSDSTDSCDFWWGDWDWFEWFWQCTRAQARAGLSCVDCYVSSINYQLLA